MRLSIWDTPATRFATFSTRLRNPPLEEVPARVIRPWTAETITPVGAMPMPISSVSAELILASKSLSKSRQECSDLHIGGYAILADMLTGAACYALTGAPPVRTRQ